MASVTERTFWIEWMKKKHTEKFNKALELMSEEEKQKVRTKAKNAWARENDVVLELRKLDQLDEKAAELSAAVQDNSRAQERVKDKVAEKKGLHGTYQAGNLMVEWRSVQHLAVQDAALKKAGIESLDKEGIEAVLMAATTTPQLLAAVEKLAAALGVIVPSIE